jgi:4-phosphopantoate--beta-alanine ligase
MHSDIPDNHPRAASLRLRAAIEAGRESGLVAPAGPIAHGRGEAYDYLLGEATPPCVAADVRVAAALLVRAQRPVISVNGNAAVLCPAALVELSKAVPAPLEVNVFYGRTEEREAKLAAHLRAHGADRVLGVDAQAKVPNLFSARGRVDKDGIAVADLVVVPLEDGDRTQALVAMGKTVLSIDLNPLSRSARSATLNLCDNLVRVVPLLSAAVAELRAAPDEAARLAATVDNARSTAAVLAFLRDRLDGLARGIAADAGGTPPGR